MDGDKAEDADGKRQGQVSASAFVRTVHIHLYTRTVTNEYFPPCSIQTAHRLSHPRPSSSPPFAPCSRLSFLHVPTHSRGEGVVSDSPPEMRVCFSVADVSAPTAPASSDRFPSQFHFVRRPSFRLSTLPRRVPLARVSRRVSSSLSAVSARQSSPVVHEETRCRLSSRLRLLPGGNAT